MTTSSLRICPAVVDDMIAHARADAPNECCGLLIGTGSLISTAWRARNARASPTRYLIDPRDQFAAVKAARAADLAVMGAYHSHPVSAPVPSGTDEREATYPEYVYVIVSLAEPDHPQLRAYRAVGDDVAGGGSGWRLLAVELVVEERR